MGSIPPELSLDLVPTYVPKSISDFLKELSSIGNGSGREEKLADYVKGLEEEMKKIEAFKRELPLCMLLLQDAIQFLKDESAQLPVSNVKPVLEEFIPLKKDCREEDGEIRKEKDCVSEKMNWMSSVQLWKSDGCRTSSFNQNQTPIVQIKQRIEEENHCATDDLSQPCKVRVGGRGFMPFKGYSPFPAMAAVPRKEDKEDLPVSSLSLLTPGSKTVREDSGSNGLSSKPGSTRAMSTSAQNSRSDLQAVSQQQAPPPQTGRKQRRCWSPELHRRFVNALQQLGGSQVATPKQIRELMQVDGLTNDEVKSHLQKYRLHTRRLPSNASSTPSNQPVVVLGGLWMSQDQYGDSSKANSGQSGSPQGPLQLTGNTGGTSTTGGDSMDDEDDEKSESYSWKRSIQKHGKDDL